MFWLQYAILCFTCGISHCMNLCLFLQLSLVNCVIVSVVPVCLPVFVCGFFPSFIFPDREAQAALRACQTLTCPDKHRRVRHSKILWSIWFPTFSNKDYLDTFCYTKPYQKKFVLVYLAHCFLVKEISQVPTHFLCA